MAKKISELKNASSIKNEDLLMIVQDGENKKVTFDKVKGNSTGLDFDSLTEVLTANDQSFLVINQDGLNKKVKVEKVKGSSNLTSEYVELTGDDKKQYRLTVKNGKIYPYLKEVDTAKEAVSGEYANYDGLIINKMYGGGSELKDTACSHSFIELYNLSTSASNRKTINLKGLYLWYKSQNSGWQSLPLKGIVPPNHSFLIRCGFHNDNTNDAVRCNITDYDMEWDIKLSDKGFTALLYIGSEEPEANPVRYNKDPHTNEITWTNPRYIDMFSAGGKGHSDNPPACEVRYIKCMDRFTGVMREDFANSGGINVGSNKKIKGNNEADALPLPFNTCDISIYRPRTVADGEWGIYLDKIRLNKNCPNLLNMCYGQDGNTSRTFTWQTKVTDDGCLRYRPVGTTKWHSIDSNKEIISSKDGESTVHKVLVKGLSKGIYEYMIGEEGMWSDIATFEVKEYDHENSIKILWTTDEQGWTKNEYKAVGTAAKFIQANEEFDFHLNTGDISQNANRSFEWRYYYRYYRDTTKTLCHMTTCGNNDLINKKYSDAFKYYSYYENQVYNSTYFWDLGFVHFVSLNSNTDMTYVDGSEAQFSSTDEFLQAQADWLDTHLQEVTQRHTKPRWLVIYMHLSPFSVSRTLRLQRFVSVFEKYKVDLVLCGHNHAYSRSKALYTGYDFKTHPEYNTYRLNPGEVTLQPIETELAANGEEIKREEDKANGTYYLMCEATGYKLTGKEGPITLPVDLQGTKHANSANQPWWYEKGLITSQPCYCMLDIGWDKISFKAYTVDGTLTKDDNLNIIVNDYIPTGQEHAQTRNNFDSLEINYSERNKE